MRAQLLGEAEHLVYVALAILNMNATLRITQQLRRLASVLQPADALLLFDRYARGVDPALQRVRAVKSVSVSKLDRR
jgi:hypothetical protein